MPSDVSRRGFLGAAAGAIAAGALPEAAPAATSPKTPDAALRALLAGNARYRADTWKRKDYSPVSERRASAQAPFAAILTCADSRISPPLVFDVERGNLFAAHVAGNSVGPDALGSIEYAVAVLKVPLVMVLGHSDCGAVKAAIDVVAGRKTFPQNTYGAIGDLVAQVEPAVRTVPAGRRTLARCIRANAVFQAEDLGFRGPIVAQAVAAGNLRVVGAVYDIATGRVRIVT
jgi:carbonic anhydrase